MKRRIFYYVTIGLLCLSLDSSATLINWTGSGTPIFGANPNDWYNTSNWSSGTVPGINDDVQIGVNSYNNSPVLNASTTVKSLSFGVASSGSLTINSGVILTISGDVTVKYASSSATINIGQTVIGSLGGSIICGGSFKVGDTTAPATPNVVALALGQVNLIYTATVNIAIQNFSIAQNLILNTTSASAFPIPATSTNSSNVNNPVLNLNNGSLSVGLNIQTTNSNYVNTILSGYSTAANTAQVLVNPSTNAIIGSSSTLSFGGTLSIATGGTVDFYGTGPGKSTTIYSGASNQTVYTSFTGLDAAPQIYQNLGFSGAGVKAIQSGSINLPGDWSSAGGNVDALTNSTSIYFLGTAQSLTDAGSNSGAGMIFGNVFFQGSGLKTIGSGKFSVANTGILTMAGTATLAAGGNLTLLSDATSSASVAALPLNTAITGNVNVQRFFKGSADLSKRGYRLISSAVYTSPTATVNFFDLKYLLDSAYVSGMATGGFNAPTGNNPTLYLYREDIASTNTSFTSGNYKGVAKINNANAYDIGIQKRLTTTNVADTTINLPVGNGALFFFRGNKTDNATQTGNKVTAPFDFPEDVTFVQTGVLNTGTINVKPWYTPTTSLSFTNSPSLNNSAVRGFVLVGNPYASTINWEKFNRSGANSSIYGGGFPAASTTQSKIWVFNPASKQYDTYIQNPSPSSVADTTTTLNPGTSMHTGNASNMIASGQGFFIRATTTGQTLSFRETAKTNSQPSTTNIIRLMDAPGANSLSFSSAPVINNSASPLLSLLHFQLSKDSINTDDVVLALNNHTDNTFSDADDVEDMNGNGALVSMSLLSSDNVATAIKQIKLPQTNQQVISLLADATTSGKYQIKLIELNNLPTAYDVWLMDSFTKDSLDIKHNNTYDFMIDKANAATYGSNRFKIVVRQNQALMMHPLSFNAVKTTTGALLSWTTENEGKGYTFSVQKSTNNGNSFTQIGEIKSSSIGTYALVDPNPAKGTNQYKVKLQNTISNYISYSNIATLLYADTVKAPVSNIAVYPNPAADVVNIKMLNSTVNNNSYSIKISNSSGRIVKQLASAQSYWQGSIAGLLPGTYIVQVINTTDNKVQGETKFVKL